MIYIRKGAAPSELTTYRERPDPADPSRPSAYDGAGFNEVKPRLREALVRDQRGICCYCTQRIAPTETEMKVEHYVPQRGENGDSTRDLDWTNLLGACCGQLPNPRGRGTGTVHCDSAKGERRITLNPLEKSHIDCLSYQRSGRLLSIQEQHQTEIDEVLNLNDEGLIERRRQVLDTLQQEFRTRYGAKNIHLEKLKKLLEHYNNPPGEQLRPFVGFLRWWLERRIRRSDPRL